MADGFDCRLVPLLAILALAACDRPRQADAKICTAFKAAAPASNPDVVAAPSAPTDGAAEFDDCLHRWGYRLAKSGDGADVVANAVVAACGEALSKWNTQALTQAGPNAPQTTLDLHTGRSTTMLEQRYAYAAGKALFYVVQGRAGNCAAP
ncbi:MAG: hypothetical protein ABIO39_05220 [Caulobacteraceae bacterium]